jgi:hypothetical protein
MSVGKKQKFFGEILNPGNASTERRKKANGWESKKIKS